jgi:RsiW-degrading membrane proteinase PrsW (M82 family)
MLPPLVRAYPVHCLAALVLLLSLIAGIVASPLVQAHRPPAEKAHALAEEKKYAEAEDEYFELAARDAGNVPVLLDLLDNHERLLEHAAEAAKEEASKQQQALDPPITRAELAGRDKRVDAIFAHLPPESALIAGYWHDVLRDQETEADGDELAGAAHDDPPVPWANHVLARAARRAGNEALAAEMFAREAEAFDARRADAEQAYRIWAARDDSKRLDEAVANARFARQLGPGVRFDLAIRRGEWMRAMRTFLASQYADTTLGTVALALVSAAVWFTICLGVGGGRRIERRFLFLYASAFGLGIASTYLTIAIVLVEHHYFPFLRSGTEWSRIVDCLIGVGPREEVSKGLMAVVPLLVAKRWGGGRREALACGALVGLGFAAEENVGYFSEGLSTALVRFLTANFFHISTTGLLAVAIDDTLRGTVSKGNGIGWTLGFVIVMHGLYDAFLEGSEKGSWVTVAIFVVVSRRFLVTLRELPGRQPSLLPIFAVGMALVVGATFVYACTLVGPRHAAVVMAGALVGTTIVIAMFANDLERSTA